MNVQFPGFYEEPADRDIWPKYPQSFNDAYGHTPEHAAARGGLLKILCVILLATVLCAVTLSVTPQNATVQAWVMSLAATSTPLPIAAPKLKAGPPPAKAVTAPQLVAQPAPLLLAVTLPPPIAPQLVAQLAFQPLTATTATLAAPQPVAQQETQQGVIKQETTDKPEQPAEKIDAMLNTIAGHIADLEQQNKALMAYQTTQKERQSALEAKISDLQRVNKENIIAINELESKNNSLRRENGDLNVEIANLYDKHGHDKNGAAQTAGPQAKKPGEADLARRSRGKLQLLPASAKTAKNSKSKKPAMADANTKAYASIEGLSVLGATQQNILVQTKEGKTVTVKIGGSWNGIKFASVDMDNGVVNTSLGHLVIPK